MISMVNFDFFFWLIVKHFNYNVVNYFYWDSNPGSFSSYILPFLRIECSRI